MPSDSTLIMEFGLLSHGLKSFFSIELTVKKIVTGMDIVGVGKSREFSTKMQRRCTSDHVLVHVLVHDHHHHHHPCATLLFTLSLPQVISPHLVLASSHLTSPCPCLKSPRYKRLQPNNLLSQVRFFFLFFWVGGGI